MHHVTERPYKDRSADVCVCVCIVWKCIRRDLECIDSHWNMQFFHMSVSHARLLKSKLNCTFSQL